MAQMGDQLDAECSTEWSEVPLDSKFRECAIKIDLWQTDENEKTFGASEFTNVEQNRIEEKRTRKKLDFVDGDMFVFEVTIPISLYPRKLADEVRLPLHKCFWLSGQRFDSSYETDDSLSSRRSCNAMRYWIVNVVFCKTNLRL